MKKALFVDLLNLFWDQHGIYSMAAVMKKNGIDVQFIGTRNFKKALERVTAVKPDILLYSAFSATIPAFIEFDRMAKKNIEVKSVIGGPGPTYDRQSIKDTTIDAECVGEGEFGLVDFIYNGFRSCNNIFCKEDVSQDRFYPLIDLDSLPFPDRSVIYNVDPLLKNFPSKQFVSGRGCPYNCTFCFNHKFREIFKSHGPAVRKKSVDYLIEEIKQVKAEYGLQNVVFHDDTFIINKKWLLEFCERFPKEIEIAYTCNIRANLIDEDVVKALKESGCRNVNWSIECGDDYLRNEVLKRGMTKDQILKTADLLRKNKIPYRIGNIIGLPGESFEQMLETVDLNIKAKPKLGIACFFVPFPGLELTEYAKKHGYYDEKNTGLPKDLFTKSALNIGKKENRRIYKLMCLFQVFISMPFLFYNSIFRKALFSLPGFVLRPVREILFTYHMASMYVVKTSFLERCRMAVRYIKNL